MGTKNKYVNVMHSLPKLTEHRYSARHYGVGFPISQGTLFRELYEYCFFPHWDKSRREAKGLDDIHT